MASNQELDATYMRTALLHSYLSKARRKQVGAVVVTSHGVTLTGYNGTPSGLSNACEDDSGATLPTVIHAELNCILKAAKEGVSCHGATAYVTLSPCQGCAAMLIQAGISRLVYLEAYRDTSGLEILFDAGVKVDKIVV